MNTKKLLFLTFILSATNNIVLGMEKETQYQTEQEMMFAHHMNQLSTPIEEFVNDFKTWPKEEKDKMTTFNNGRGTGYIFNDRPAAANNPKYNGNVGYYLDCRLDYHQLEQFLWTIEYLKNRKDK